MNECLSKKFLVIVVFFKVATLSSAENIPCEDNPNFQCVQSVCSGQLKRLCPATCGECKGELKPDTPKAIPCPHTSAYACDNYKVLDQPDRYVNNTVAGNIGFLSDTNLVEGWYRFMSRGRDATMASFCVDVDHCGTQIPIWQNGPLPSVQDGAVQIKGCINHGSGFFVEIAFPGPKCCQETQDICIKNCNNFYVYRLVRVDAPNMAYCTGNPSPPIVCPPGKHLYGSRCTDPYPKMNNPPVLGSPICDNGALKFPCTISFDQTDKDATFEVKWMVDGMVLNIPRQTTPIVQTLTNGTRVAFLDAFNLIGNTNKHLQCGVTSYYTGVSYRSQPSNSSSPGTFIGVSVSPKSITVSEKGKPQNITLSTSITQCSPLGNTPSCGFNVELKTSENFYPDASTYRCNYTFSYNPNTHKCEAVVTVIATRDFVKDGNKTHVLAFRPIKFVGPPTNQNLMWLNHQLDPVNVTTIDQPKGVCSVYSDPHITTLSKSSVDTQDVGYMVLYKVEAGCGAVTRTMEVNIRTRRCHGGRSANSCVCGLAVQEGNDYVVHDRCYGNFTKSQSLDDGSKFSTDKGGKTFNINLVSGALVKFTSYQERLLVTVEAPSDHDGCVHGQCGRFDGQLLDPYGGKQTDATLFAHSWLVKEEDSLFFKRAKPTQNNGTRFCHCSPGGIANCTRAAKNPLQNVVAGGQILQQNKQKKMTPTGRRSVTRALSETNPDTVKLAKKSTGWPTVSGKTLSYATSKCRDTIQKGSLYNFCQNSLAAYPTLMHGCVDDIKITDSLDFLNDYIMVYDDLCLSHIASDLSYYVTGHDGQSTLTTDVTSKLCPNYCSFRGTCHQGECLCPNGFQGPDCSVANGAVPSIKHIYGGGDVPGICDVRNDDCQTATVIANNIFYTNNLKCSLQTLKMVNNQLVPDEEEPVITVDGIFRSFEEVECPLPVSKVSNGVVVGGYKIRLTTDRTHFSGEETLVIYDSICKHCHENGTCNLKPNTCEIFDQCQYRGEQNSDHQICDPSVNKNGWTDDIRVTEINHKTASIRGCECFDNPGSYECACCKNGGCQCGSVAPHLCVDCSHQNDCRLYPEIYNLQP